MEILSEEWDDLCLWMQLGKALARKHPDLDESMQSALEPVFNKYFLPLGIDPDGNPIRKEKQ